MAKLLLSPLGRSPGAVSGLYHRLVESGEGIDRLIVLSTSDPAVQESAKALRRHFRNKPKDFLSLQPVSSGDDAEMVSERAVYGFIHRVNRVLYDAQHDGDEVHMGIAGGRKSMSALATLSAYVYGAAAVYHFWVHEKIEEWGDIYSEQFLSKEQFVMHPSQFKPSDFGGLGEQSCRLVPIPLAPFDRLWEKGQLPEVLTENERTRQALLRAVSEREWQELEDLCAQHLTLDEAIQRARQVLEMTDGEWLVGAAIKLSVTEGNVNYEVELKPYIPNPCIRTQIARKLKNIDTLAGASGKFLAYLMGVLTPILVAAATG